MILKGKTYVTTFLRMSPSSRKTSRGSNMYYLIKLIQATGLTLILIGFIKNFPELMDFKIFLIGIILFLSGWAANKFMVK